MKKAIDKIFNNNMDRQKLDLKPLGLLVKEREKMKKNLIKLADAGEMLWVVLANVSGGDWSKQSKEWQKYAAKWRNNYFEVIKEAGLTRPREKK